MTPQPPDPRLPQYPVLQFITRRSKAIPPAAFVLVLAVSLWASLRTGTPDFAAIGFVLALLAHFAMRGVLELLALVTELLIPR